MSTQITPDVIKKMQAISRQLKNGESVRLKDGDVEIIGEGKTRADRRRLASLRRKYQTTRENENVENAGQGEINNDAVLGEVNRDGA